MATEHIGLRLDSELVKRIDKVAAAEQTSRTAVIERAIRLGLKEEEEVVEMLEGDTIKNIVERTIVGAMLNPTVLNLMTKLVGDEVDPKRVEKLRELMDAKKGKRAAKPALE